MSANTSNTMHIRINPKIKEQAMPILEELSISIGEYFNMALSQLVQQHRVPFELGDSVYFARPHYAEELLRDAAEMREAINNGTAKPHSSTAEMFSEWEKEDAENE